MRLSSFWNVVGSVGFLLCGALGYSSARGAVYESGLATFWGTYPSPPLPALSTVLTFLSVFSGSFGFLIGSTLQIGEALWRDPSSEDE